MLLGQLERVDESCVAGWIANTDGAAGNANLRVTINGTDTITAVADIVRSDVPAETATGVRGFQVDISGSLRPGYNNVRVDVTGADFAFAEPERKVFWTPKDGAFGRSLRANPDLFLFESMLKRAIEAGIPLRSDIGRRRMTQVLRETRLVFILFTNRSGSNVITDMLSNMGIGGGVTHEPFLVNVMREQIEKHGYSSIEHYLAERIAAYNRNGTAFLKIGWDALFFLSASGVLDGAFRNACCIWARRRDKLLQAISYIKALKSGVFFESGDEGARPKPLETFWKGTETLDEIARAMHQMHIADMRLGYFLETQGLEFLEVFYEDLNEDMQSFYTKLQTHVEKSLGITTLQRPFAAKLRKHESPEAQQIKQLYLDLARLPDRENAG